MQGRAPMHPGRGPGLSSRRLGEKGGVNSVTLSEAQMPNHTHTLVASDEDGDSLDPTNKYVGAGNTMFAAASNLEQMPADTLPNQGGSQAHTNLQPYLGINFIIALQGLYPSRG